MSAIRSHTASIKLTELPDVIAGCAQCLPVGRTCVHLRMCQSCGRTEAAIARRTGTPRPTPAAHGTR